MTMTLVVYADFASPECYLAGRSARPIWSPR